MSSQLHFLFQQAILYLHGNNLDSAELLLKQIIKKKTNHSEALRHLAFISSRRGNNELALEIIEKAISADKKSEIAFSNRGNIQLGLGMVSEAIESHLRAIKLNPEYADAYGNLANAQQELFDYESAILNYKIALQKNPTSSDFLCNLGNCLVAMGRPEEALISYKNAIELEPNHADSKYFMGLLELLYFEFSNGWIGNEYRWNSRTFNSEALKTSKKRWQGQVLSGPLFIWAEQGIGDQILYASLLHEVKSYAKSVIVSVDYKLLPVLRHSFPEFEFIAKTEILEECKYDAHIPIGSIGQLLRREIGHFKRATHGYLLPNQLLVDKLKKSNLFSKKIRCGLSWRSNNKALATKKSISLDKMLPILSLGNDIEFINLQYGDNVDEIRSVKESKACNLTSIPELDLFNDMEGLFALIESCDIIVTTSNSTAHFAGSMGKETLLLLPFSAGKFWYWHDVDGLSLWYPSIKVFKQENEGDWSRPITAVKAYLERRFGI